MNNRYFCKDNQKTGMKYKCIIFDFDGTLADTTAGIVSAFQGTFVEMGLPVPSVEKIKSTIGLALKEGFKAAMETLSDEQADHAVETYRRIFYASGIQAITAYPGITYALSRLKETGYDLVIATSRGHRSLGLICDNLGITNFFSGQYCSDDVVNHKPAPDIVNLILKEKNLSRSEVLVVGDAHYDMLMGKAAGCKVCGVTWGNQSREQLQSVGPDHIIDDIKELFEII